ncbi:two component transcriptional regulator, LuxR family [Paenibacillus uliginis N3/975]|uniref:Two component transcriptional regulator, LuxR family n=1 Tax=Paenibacillus uliginis N3/975 TaxID=1313296 RepID=A0A1X7HNB6_9BACL|nr:response regulator transcription factor [Paenibacillus uliginis]SMF89702.1 two component transcriptional regulator, LuxR family [Paenibacillus uliginis N3/975]
MYQILLVDDHPSVMEGTKMLLEQEGDLIVTLANTGDQALELAKEHPFDVMLIDLHMPGINGIDLAKKILTAVPEAIILTYTGYDFMNHFNLMIEAGIAGLVHKTSNKEQLVTAVRCALRGEVVLPLSLVRQMRRTTDHGFKDIKDTGTSSITGKEYKILKQIAGGKSNKEIAEQVIMSQRSLEYCLTNLFQKLNVKSRIEAVMKAKNLGLLSDSDFIKQS